MPKKSVSNWLLLLASTALVAGCNYHVDKAANSNPAAQGQKPGPSIADFETVKAEVLTPKCLRCHDGSGESDLREYALVNAALVDIRDRVTRTDSQRMPKRDSLTPEQLNLLLGWIDAGAPETESGKSQPEPGATPVPIGTPAPLPPSVPTPVPASEILPTYTSINEKIFSAHACLKCHTGGDDGEAHYDMNSLATILRDDADAVTRRDPVSSKLIKSVTRTDNKRMPKGRRPPLAPKEIEVLKRWIELGSPP